MGRARHTLRSVAALEGVEGDAQGGAGVSQAHGTTPAGKAVRSRELLGRFVGRRRIELSILIPLPLSLAMLGRLDEARRTAERAMAIAGDLGARWSVALAAWMAGQSEHVAGEFAAALPVLVVQSTIRTASPALRVCSLRA